MHISKRAMKEKKMIAFYVSQSEYHACWHLFDPKDNDSTEVAVSSPSRYAREAIAEN